MNNSVEEIGRGDKLQHDFVVNQVNKQIDGSFDVIENGGCEGVEGVNWVGEALVQDVVEKVLVVTCLMNKVFNEEGEQVLTDSEAFEQLRTLYETFAMALRIKKRLNRYCFRMNQKTQNLTDLHLDSSYFDSVSKRSGVDIQFDTKCEKQSADDGITENEVDVVSLFGDCAHYMECLKDIHSCGDVWDDILIQTAQ